MKEIEAGLHLLIDLEKESEKMTQAGAKVNLPIKKGVETERVKIVRETISMGEIIDLLLMIMVCSYQILKPIPENLILTTVKRSKC